MGKRSLSLPPASHFSPLSSYLPVRIIALLGGASLLCGFQAGNANVLEIPGGNHSRSGAATYEDSSEVVPRGPDLQFHQLLKFFGCWKATITGRDLSAFSDVSGKGPGKWIDKRYTICFARDLAGELQPTLSQTQLGGNDIEDKGSYTELVSFDDRVVSLVNRYRFVDNSAAKKAPTVSWFGFKRSSPQPLQVQEMTRINCVRERMDLVCAATATADCGESACYSFSWKAKFNTF